MSEEGSKVPEIPAVPLSKNFKTAETDLKKFEKLIRDRHIYSNYNANMNRSITKKFKMYQGGLNMSD